MVASACSRKPDGTVGAEGFQIPEATTKGWSGLPADLFFFFFFIWPNPASKDDLHTHAKVIVFRM